MVTTLRDIIEQATLKLKSQQFEEAKESFKLAIDTGLQNADPEILSVIILEIASAYQGAEEGQPDVLQYNLRVLESMREIFPQTNDQGNAQIAMFLNNLYYDYPKNSNSATQLELLEHLNEGLSIANNISNINPNLFSGLQTKIEKTCDNLFEIASFSNDFQEQLSIFSSILNSIKSAFPEGNPKAVNYQINLATTYINLNDFNKALLNLYKSTTLYQDQSTLEATVSMICDVTKNIFHNQNSIENKILISSDMFTYLPKESQQALVCTAYMKNALALEYSKLAITEWYGILPYLDEETKQSIQNKIDSSCLNLNYAGTKDCIAGVVGVNLDQIDE